MEWWRMKGDERRENDKEKECDELRKRWGIFGKK